MRKIIAMFLALSFLALSGNLYAEKKGADLIIQKTDGNQVRGELIAVKQNSLILMERDSGADRTIAIDEARAIRIVKESHLALGAILGMAIGGIVGKVAEGPSYNSSPGVPVFWPSGLGIAIGIGIGAIVGGVIFAVAGTDETIQFEGKSESEIKEILDKLRKKARIKNA